MRLEKYFHHGKIVRVLGLIAENRHSAYAVAIIRRVLPMRGREAVFRDKRSSQEAAPRATVQSFSHAITSSVTRENVDKFWELIDNTLNVILCVLLGLELLVTP